MTENTDTPTEALSEREAFEKWAQPKLNWPGFDLLKCPINGYYASLTTEYAWMAWQARGEYERTRHTPQPDAPDGWPENVVADRHETTGKWVLWYLTDGQAARCRAALLPTLTAAPELPSLEDVARIIYKWSEIERDDLSIVKYDELSGGLKEMLHRHARAVLTAAKVKWRE